MFYLEAKGRTERDKKIRKEFKGWSAPTNDFFSVSCTHSTYVSPWSSILVDWTLFWPQHTPPYEKAVSHVLQWSTKLLGGDRNSQSSAEAHPADKSSLGWDQAARLYTYPLLALTSATEDRDWQSTNRTESEQEKKKKKHQSRVYWWHSPITVGRQCHLSVPVSSSPASGNTTG